MVTTVYLLFDDRMSLHRPNSMDRSSHTKKGETSILFENPARTRSIYNRLMKMENALVRKNFGNARTQPTPVVSKDSKSSPSGLKEEENQRFIHIPCKPAKRETIELVHSAEHYEKMFKTAFLSEVELKKLTIQNDLYFCGDTFLAATLACGGVVNCVDAVTSKETGECGTRAIALVRPPGHHAGRNEAMGFCYFNNIAVAAKHAIRTKRASRVFVLDWDIHHGNGIQDLTYDDPDIFYLSIHRASFSHATKASWFYPGTGRHSEVGRGDGVGTNLNIAWGQSGMGNVEYAAAFSEVVLPLLSFFQPSLILIACGLDAVKGDLLGDCGLTSDMYYHMTKSILETAGISTPIVAVLEGGYNLDLIADCMEAVALALLDEPLEAPIPFSSATLDDSSGRKPDADNNSDPGLSQYWQRELLASARNGSRHEATKNAISSIKQSAKAIATHGACLSITEGKQTTSLKCKRTARSQKRRRGKSSKRDQANIIARKRNPVRATRG